MLVDRINNLFRNVHKKKYQERFSRCCNKLITIKNTIIDKKLKEISINKGINVDKIAICPNTNEPDTELDSEIN
jgi:hypothetical protein